MVIVAAATYSLPTAVALGLTAGVCQSLGKLSLDALIQRDVPEAVRTSVFARSETLLQLSWVVGGFLGIALPLSPTRVSLGVAAVLLTGWTVFVLRSLIGLRRQGARVCSGAPRLPLLALLPPGLGGSSPTPRLRGAAHRIGHRIRSGVELVGEGAQQRSGLLGAAPLGVATVAVVVAETVQQADQVLDDDGHVLGRLAPGLDDRRGRVEHAHLQRLVAAAALHDPELHPRARAQRRGPRGHRVGADEDVAALLGREEAETLVGVVPLDLACWHRDLAGGSSS